MTGIPDLPPLPGMDNSVFMCFTQQTDSGWVLLNSLFDLHNAQDVSLWHSTPGNLEGCALVLSRDDSWERTVQKIVNLPQILNALDKNLAWYVFGKANLIDPVFNWAMARRLLGRKPCTVDVLSEKFPGMFMTAENRSSFTQPFCQWLTGADMPTPLHFLKC